MQCLNIKIISIKVLNGTWELHGVSEWIKNPLRLKNGRIIVVQNHGEINQGMIRTTLYEAHR